MKTWKLVLSVSLLSIVLLASACLKSYLEKKPAAYISPQPDELNIKPGDVVTFHDLSDFGKSSEWEMDNSTGATYGSSKDFTVTFGWVGTYTISLTSYSSSKGKFDKTTKTYTCSNGTSGPTGNTGPGTSCIVGTWTKSYCSVTSTLVFSSGGTGTFDDTDCSGAYARHQSFTWTESSGTMSRHYTSFTISGANQPLPADETFSFTCSGNSLSFNGTNWTK